MKIFITGSTGFVGSHLIDYLRSPENKIFGAFFPATSEKAKKMRGVELFYMDITDEKETYSAVKAIRPDWIFHLAAVSNVKYSWNNRRETMETNILGTFHLFEVARKLVPSARILFISSSDVYGIHMHMNRPFKEEAVVHPVSPYAYTKISGESLCQFYSQIEELDIVTARSFPHTGPGQSPDFVCSDWARQIANIEKEKAEPVLKVGNIDVERDFLDVRDVVKAYTGLLKRGKKGEVYNVCSGKAVALRNILQLLLSFSSKKADMNVDPEKLRKADIPILFGDNGKIKQDVKWEPQISLRQTLSDLLDYWRQSL